MSICDEIDGECLKLYNFYKKNRNSTGETRHLINLNRMNYKFSKL